MATSKKKSNKQEDRDFIPVRLASAESRRAIDIMTGALDPNQERVDIDSDAGNTQGRTGVVTPREKTLFRMSQIRTACSMIGAICGMASVIVAMLMAWKVLHMGR